MKFGIGPVCAGGFGRHRCSSESLHPLRDVSLERKGLCHKAENHRIGAGYPRCLHCRHAFANALDGGLSRSADSQGSALQKQAISQKQCKPVLSSERNQLICRFLRLGGPARRGRRQAQIDKSIGKRVAMDGLSGLQNPVLQSSSRLVGIATVPERPRPDALSSYANIRTKSERELPVLLRPI